jgi:YfiH family protein
MIFSSLLSEIPGVKAAFGSKAGLIPYPEDFQKTMPIFDQVHGCDVGWVDLPQQDLGKVDALITSCFDVLIGVKTADCVPILAAHRFLPWIFSIHAGWRGLASGIVEKSFSEWEKRTGLFCQDLVACIGPCIQMCCYEVKSDMIALFAKQNPDFALSEWSSLDHVSLSRIAKYQMQKKGIQVEMLDFCTFHSQDPLFASYRRGKDGGKETDRQWSVIKKQK